MAKQNSSGNSQSPADHILEILESEDEDKNDSKGTVEAESPNLADLTECLSPGEYLNIESNKMGKLEKRHRLNSE